MNQNNTLESDSFQDKNNSLQTLCDISCQKKVLDSRSSAIRQGLQGDQDLQILCSINDLGVGGGQEESNENKQLRILRNLQDFRLKSQDYNSTNFGNNNQTCSQRSNDKVYELKLGERLSYQSAQNEVNIALSASKKSSETQSSQEEAQKETELVNSPITKNMMVFFESNSATQQNNNFSTLIENNSTIQQFNLRDKSFEQQMPSCQYQISKFKRRLCDPIMQAVQIKLHTQEFIRRLTFLKNNRRMDNTTTNQIEMINDQSHYQYDLSQKIRVHRLVLCFERVCTWFSCIPVFIPTHQLRLIWDKFLLIYLYSFFFWFSIMIFFNQNEANSIFPSYFCLITLIVMMIDIFIEMNTALFVKDSIILDHKLIIKSYILSLHFFTDFISLIVFFTQTVLEQNIVFNPESNIQSYIYILIPFTKFYSVNLKRRRLESLITFKFNSKHLYRLFSQVFSVLQIAHIGWYSLTFIKSNSTNWIERLHIESSPYYQKYIYSVYWAITTMTTVGYGDITATNPSEALYISINMIIFSVVFAYSINNIGSILQDIEQSSKKLKEDIQTIERYLVKKNVNSQLKRRVVQYLHDHNEEEKTKSQKEEEAILSILSKKLKEEITLDANSQIISHFDVFKSFSLETQKNLVFLMKEVIVSPNEIIFQEGDYDEKSIYLVSKGKIEIIHLPIHKLDNPIIVRELTNFSFFGEISFFSSLARQATARSVNMSTLYKIDRQDFINLIRNNKKDFELFKTIEHNINLNRDYKQIQTKCFSCGKYGHIVRQCPYIHQTFDYQFIMLRSNYSIFQERKSVHRQYLKQFKARMLIELNKLLVSKLKVEIQNDMRSGYELSLVDQPITNIELEEYQRFMDEDMITSDATYLAHHVNQSQFANPKTSIIKNNNNHNTNEQLISIKNRSIIPIQISSRSNIKDKPDLNIKLQLSNNSNITNNDKTEIIIDEKEEQHSNNSLLIESTPQFKQSYANFEDCMKSEVSNQSQKVLMKTRNSQQTFIKNLNNLEVNETSKFGQKAGSFIELDSINVSASLVNESTMGQEQKYHCQLSSQSTILLSPEEKKYKNNQAKRNSSKVRTQQNNTLPDFVKQISSMNLEKEEELRMNKLLNSEKLQFLQKQQTTYVNKQVLDSMNSMSKIESNQNLEKTSENIQTKILEGEHIRHRERNNRVNSSTLRQLVYQVNEFDEMHLFRYYFPKFNYDKMIKQFNYLQLKRLKELKTIKVLSQKQRRPNFCLQSTVNHSINQHIQQFNYLTSLSIKQKKSNVVLSDQLNPTNLSYGISLKGCHKYPNKYEQSFTQNNQKN